jgi:hypothetical protein
VYAQTIAKHRLGADERGGPLRPLDPYYGTLASNPPEIHKAALKTRLLPQVLDHILGTPVGMSHHLVLLPMAKGHCLHPTIDCHHMPRLEHEVEDSRVHALKERRDVLGDAAALFCHALGEDVGRELPGPFRGHLDRMPGSDHQARAREANSPDTRILDEANNLGRALWGVHEVALPEALNALVTNLLLISHENLGPGTKAAAISIVEGIAESSSSDHRLSSCWHSIGGSSRDEGGRRNRQGIAHCVELVTLASAMRRAVSENSRVLEVVALHRSMGTEEGPQVVTTPLVPRLCGRDCLRDLAEKVLQDWVGVEGARVLREKYREVLASEREDKGPGEG